MSSCFAKLLDLTRGDTVTATDYTWGSRLALKAPAGGGNKLWETDPVRHYWKDFLTLAKASSRVTGAE